MAAVTCCLIFSVCVSGCLAFKAVTVDLNGHAVLPCNGSAFRHTPVDQLLVRWVTKDHEHQNEQLVAQYEKAKFTAGRGFEDRVTLSQEKLEKGDFSLSISPAVYNDKDSYHCVANGVELEDVRLEVLVPTEVHALAGDSSTLHFYSNVDRLADVDQHAVRWQKDGKDLHISGSIIESLEFDNRTSVSTDQISHGQLSLTINQARLSDTGMYRCFYHDQAAYPDEIHLIITGRQANLSITSGQNLHLPLHTLDPVTVQFSSQHVNVSVCTVEGSLAICDPDYVKRTSVQNGVLVLVHVTPADGGTYRVRNSMTKDVINTVSVSVIPSRLRRGVVVGVVVGVGVVVTLLGVRHLVILYRRRSHPVPTQHYSNPEQETRTGSSDSGEADPFDCSLATTRVTADRLPVPESTDMPSGDKLSHALGGQTRPWTDSDVTATPTGEGRELSLTV